MNLNIRTACLRFYQKNGGRNKLLLKCIPADSHSDWRAYTFDSAILTHRDVELLLAASGELNAGGREEADFRQRLRGLIAWHKMGGKRVINLPLLADLLRDHLLPLRRHWLFQKSDVDQHLLAWYVKSVVYVAQTKYARAHVAISLVAKRRGEEVTKTRSIFREQLGSGISAPELLEKLDYLVESDELLEVYEKEQETYRKYVGMNGEQFLAIGKGRTFSTREEGEDGEDRVESFWNRDDAKIVMDRDGAACRVVMDDAVSFGEGGKGEDKIVYAYEGFWLRAVNSSPDHDADADDDNDTMEVDGADSKFAPIHPYVGVFSMGTHEYVRIHVNNLQPYIYDETLGKKLVLPNDHRALINTLIGASTRGAEDLVRGKKGGVVILCSGPPGSGKTLTAEVYAEIAKRPLYTVQCSQLGVSPKEFEKSLSICLRRAMRWDAVMLIDEADVYIHERGQDVNQNAIVGVFLRLLEYYAGILFLTTNRAVVVDDAIHSRCLAHVRYTLPDEESRQSIWTILAEQYRVELTGPLLRELVKAFPVISGRQIKQLLRLAKTMEGQKKLSLDLFKWLAKYQEDLTTACKPS